MNYTTTCPALIKQINDALEKQANNILRESGLTMSQVAVLIELDSAEGKQLHLKALERRFEVAQPTMLGIVRRLEEKDYVTMIPDENDRRMKLVRLSGEGEKKCEYGYTHMNLAESNLLSALNEDEREQFKTLLEKIKKSFV